MKISKQNSLFIAITLLMLVSSACGMLATDDSARSNAEASDTGDLTSASYNGSSVSKPAPLGSSIVQDNVEVTVLSVVRGQVDDVGSILSDSSLRYALSRPPDHEWVVVSLKVRNVGSPDSLTKTYSTSDFNLIDSQDNSYPVDLLVETNNPLSSVMLGLPIGTEAQGDIVFHVGEDDKGSVLKYAPLLVIFGKPKYLALVESVSPPGSGESREAPP